MSAAVSDSAAPPPAAVGAPVPVLPDYRGACIANVVPTLITGEDPPDGRCRLAARDRPSCRPGGPAGPGRTGLGAAPGPGVAGAHPVGRRGHRAGHHLGGAHHDGLCPHLDHHRASAERTRTAGLPTGPRRPDPQRAAVDARQWPGRDVRRRGPGPSAPAVPFLCPARPATVPVVSKHEFGGTGFTAAHLGNSPLHGYRVPVVAPTRGGPPAGRGRATRSTPTTTGSTRWLTAAGSVSSTTPSWSPWTGWSPIWWTSCPPGRRWWSRPTTDRSTSDRGWSCSGARSWPRCSSCPARVDSAGCTPAPAPRPTSRRRSPSGTATPPG